jgi:Cytochrome c3
MNPLSLRQRFVLPQLLVLAALFLLALYGPAHSPPQSEVSQVTDDRLASPGWWPTKGTAMAKDFVGTAECARCHTAQATRQIETPMAHASTPAATAAVLRDHGLLTSQLPPYRYEIKKMDEGSSYSVADSNNAISSQLAWAFGVAHKGQTYIYERNGLLYESRLSFYPSLAGLDLTTGHSAAIPDTLEAALGRRLDADESRRCFGCHTTGSTLGGHFDPAHATAGVTCEQCHGPGAKHVGAMKSGKIEEGRRAVLNPRRLDPGTSVDFCGACHRTWADVLQAGTKGVANVRFQPYRLENSRCWRQGDARLACIACHNPHQQLVHDATAYDAKCLACHVASKTEKRKDRPGTACPASTKNCVSCHMPRVEIPSMHASFADHRIRIARTNTPYPN